MSEIQSAEEFAKIVYQMCGPIGRNIEDGTSWLSEMLRARDKAWVERCKAKGEDYMPNKAAWADWCSALDDVLRKLGGEQ